MNYDFYYSKLHHEHLKQMERYYPPLQRMVYTPAYFKGMEYTEMVQQGNAPVTAHFGDLVHLGIGTYEDVSFQSPSNIQQKQIIADIMHQDEQSGMYQEDV